MGSQQLWLWLLCIGLLACSPTTYADPRQEEVDFTYSTDGEDAIVTLRTLGAWMETYEYTLFGDGRFQWQLVSAGKRDVHSSDEIYLSEQQVREVLAYAVGQLLVSDPDEAKRTPVAVRPITDSPSIALRIHLTSFESAKRTEVEPFSFGVVEDSIKWRLAHDPSNRRLQAAVQFEEVFAATREQRLFVPLDHTVGE